MGQLIENWVSQDRKHLAEPELFNLRCFDSEFWIWPCNHILWKVNPMDKKLQNKLLICCMWNTVSYCGYKVNTLALVSNIHVDTKVSLRRYAFYQCRVQNGKIEKSKVFSLDLWSHVFYIFTHSISCSCGDFLQKIYLLLCHKLKLRRLF